LGNPATLGKLIFAGKWTSTTTLIKIFDLLLENRFRKKGDAEKIWAKVFWSVEGEAMGLPRC